MPNYLVIKGKLTMIEKIKNYFLIDRYSFYGYLFTYPSIIFFIIFFIIPIAWVFWMSLHTYQDWGSPRFVGVANYIELFNESPIFWQTVLNTLYFVVLYVVMLTILGLIVALYLDTIKNSFLRQVLRVIIFLPVIISLVATSITWKWMYQQSFGVFNYILHSLGIGWFPWLTSEYFVIPAIAIASVWQRLGFATILFETGLLNIPEMYEESGKIDGANMWQLFWRIKFPLLLPVLLLVIVMSLITAFKVFTQVFVMTKGAPGHASSVMVLRIYRTVFESLNIGKGAAMSIILLIIILSFTVVQIQFLGGKGSIR